jgi:hypothetical protein
LNTKKLSTGAIAGLGRALPMLVAVAVLLSLPWLKEQPEGVINTIAAVVVVFAVGWSLFIRIAVTRRQDEVERASSKWAWRWGSTVGGLFVLLLLALPPFRDFVSAGLNGFLMDTRGHTREAAIVGFALGAITLSIAQSIGTLVMSLVWWRGK